jgi:peptidoglycan hydrolase-like protein with peptidoglycan-binding domain
MPQTLNLGATGQDVILLQTRLNALPSALPLLDVNGDFGPETLQRVKEFQTNSFVRLCRKAFRNQRQCAVFGC